MCHSCPPRAVLILAGARALDRKDVGAGHDPVEGCVVVQDAPDAGAELAEELADLLLAGGQAPLREKHLGVVREQVQDAAAGRGHALVVERFQILERHRLPLLIRHREPAHRHGYPSSSLARFSQSRMNLNTFSAGGIGAKVSSHRTGWLPTLIKVWTQPTLVHRTSPGPAL